MNLNHPMPMKTPTILMRNTLLRPFEGDSHPFEALNETQSFLMFLSKREKTGEKKIKVKERIRDLEKEKGGRKGSSTTRKMRHAYMG